MTKSKEEWERIFVISFIRLRDFFLEQDEDLLGKQRSRAISDLLIGYFCERRPRIPIKEPSPYMSCKDAALYINDCILFYINDEKKDLMEIDWRDLFVLKEDLDNLIFEEEDDEDLW